MRSNLHGSAAYGASAAKSASVIVVAFLALLTCAPTPPVQAREAPRGTIYLTTLPSGADTWVDGEYVGRSPVLVDALSTGKHTITTAKTGWVSHEERVTITERQPFQFVDFELDRDANAPNTNGTLSLHSADSIKSLTVDGNSVRPTGGRVDLAPGDHTLVVETAHGKFMRHVVIYPDTTTNVVFRSSGTVVTDDRTVVVAPTSNYLPASDVSLDGKRLTIRHNGHLVKGTLGDSTMTIDGDPMTFDAAPALIGGKLILPLDLYVRIGAVPLRPR
jgi:hypothetical protein